MKKKQAIFNWSGGKDSALALYHVLKDDEFDINQLVTTVNLREELKIKIYLNIQKQRINSIVF